MAALRSLALALALFASMAGVRLIQAAQDGRDPLVDPPSGGVNSRFQVVGQVGWIPGETVTLRLAFTSSDTPLLYDGPFPYLREITVLRDGTWFYPIVVREDVLGFPLGPEPGFIVVRAESATQTVINAYVLTVNGASPRGAETLGHAGFGPSPRADATGIVALFALGVGVLLGAGGMQRAMRRA